MQTVNFFSEKFSQVDLSDVALNGLFLSFKKCAVQSNKVDDISKDLFSFIHRYYANGEPAKSDLYSVNRVWQLLKLRKEIWQLAEEITTGSAHSPAPAFYTLMQKENKIIDILLGRIQPGKQYHKLTSASLQLLLANPEGTDIVRKAQPPKQEPAVKEKKKKHDNAVSRSRYPFPFHSGRQTTASGFQHPYRIFTIEDYLCRGMNKRYSPFIYTGMTA